jgi:hypothetical protein
MFSAAVVTTTTRREIEIAGDGDPVDGLRLGYSGKVSPGRPLPDRHPQKSTMIDIIR